jgi:flagellar basal body P-ring formation protein FlgA
LALWPGVCKYQIIMKIPTENWHIGNWFAWVATMYLCSTTVLAETIQSLDNIRQAAQRFVRDHVPAAPATLEVTVSHLDSRLRLASCIVPLQTTLPVGARFAAKTVVAVSCPDSKRWTVYVPVTIETQVSSLVLRHALARGDKVAAADVETRLQKIPGLASHYVTDVATLENRSLRRSLGAGTVLTVEAFSEDSVIKRGQHVTLMTEIAGIQVRAAGKALSDARPQQRVKVQNLQSLSVVEGVAESDSVIRVSP